MGVTVRVDKQTCASSGGCVADAPEAFGFDADQLASVLPGAASLSREQLVAIAKNCPVMAIALLEEDGSEVDLWD